MRLVVPIACGLLGLVTNAAAGSAPHSLSTNARQLLTESMNWMDIYYDASAGYLYDVSGTAALRHETRSSAWYALGLLARNDGDDVRNAETIIRNVIQGQYRNVSEQW